MKTNESAIPENLGLRSFYFCRRWWVNASGTRGILGGRWVWIKRDGKWTVHTPGPGLRRHHNQKWLDWPFRRTWLQWVQCAKNNVLNIFICSWYYGSIGTIKTCYENFSLKTHDEHFLHISLPSSITWLQRMLGMLGMHQW